MINAIKMSILGLALVFLTTGCIVRTYNVVKDRQDLQVAGQGNQGYLMGAPKEDGKVEKTTRKLYVTEIEMGSPYEEKALIEKRKQEKAEKKVAKRQGKAAKKESAVKGEALSEESMVIVGEQDTQPTVAETTAKVKTYVVKKGDTLEKIAARPEIYGNKKKWYKIFKANENRLKEPNRIFPGQVLNIPE
ncbi:MAG: LysM peptidoglycan-binding domain-containing protein [Candidatus Omnitrophica bacterium]|nr:LysM peptidoglycan-binding domain-containing protein [Candidatus Omnitrophota bacterium]